MDHNIHFKGVIWTIIRKLSLSPLFYLEHCVILCSLMPIYFKFWKQKRLDFSIKSNQVQQRTTKVKGMSQTFLNEKKTTEQIVWKRQNTGGIATWHGISKFVIIIFQDIFFWLSKYEGNGYVLKDDDGKIKKFHVYEVFFM